MNRHLKLPTRRRLFWLLGALGVILLITYIQRSRLVALPHSQAYRCLQARDLEGAMWWVSLADRLAPENAESHFLRARICRRQGKLDLVREHLIEARDLGLSFERIVREEWLAEAQAGQLSSAEPHLAELLTDPRGDEAEICEAYALGFMRMRRFSTAILLLSTWESDFADDPQPLYLHAEILREEQRWEEARQKLERVLVLQPNHGLALVAMGEVLLVMKQPQSALPFLEKVQSDPDLASRAEVGAALAKSALGEHQAARQLLLELIGREPANTEALLALAQLDFANGQYAQALPRLETALSSKPRDLDLRYARATALRGVGKAEQAKQEFEEVARARRQLQRAFELTEQVTRKPNDIGARYEIGEIYLQSGLEKEAAIWLHSVLDYDPRHTKTHRTLAQYYAQRAEQNSQFSKLARKHAELAKD